MRRIGLILGGQPRVVTEFLAGAMAGTGADSAAPIQSLAPMLDLAEVGTGATIPGAREKVRLSR